VCVYKNVINAHTNTMMTTTTNEATHQHTHSFITQIINIHIHLDRPEHTQPHTHSWKPTHSQNLGWKHTHTCITRLVSSRSLAIAGGFVVVVV